MLLNKYYFRFSILGTFLAVLGISLFFSLGTWQVNRAGEKEKLQHDIESRQNQPEFILDSSIVDISSKSYVPVKALGHYDAKHEILIDNEVVDGKAGYHVLTPLILKEDQSVIMVNRGWVPLGRSRDVLPELTTPENSVIIHGRISPHKSKPALILDQGDTEPGRVWQYFDDERYMKHTKYNLLPVVILLDEEQGEGYLRSWPKYSAKVAMHIGYAVQWYVFAAIVLITYIAVNFKKKEQSENSGTNNE
jgi:surfeit locus 1 family protein